MTEARLRVDPYTQATEAVKDLLGSGIYDRSKLSKAFDEVANAAPTGGKSIKESRPVYETLYGYLKSMQDLAEVAKDQTGIFWFRERANSYQAILELADNPNLT